MRVCSVNFTDRDIGQLALNIEGLGPSNTLRGIHG